jgi:hypothetical protein
MSTLIAQIQELTDDGTQVQTIDQGLVVVTVLLIVLYVCVLVSKEKK